MEILPFKGYRYNRAVVADVGLCIGPPYDVIDADQQKKLHKQSKYNIVRVIKGFSWSDDDENNNVYTRAAEFLESLIEQGAIKRDQEESIYVYAQDFPVGDDTYRRSGFIALGKLQDYGQVVKPHEQTLSGPKADRLNLMRATKSQIGQIFVLYSDLEKAVDAILDRACQGEELLYCKDDDVEHRLYAVTDPEEIATIIRIMADKDIFIADGHHRYETALNYCKESQNPAAAYRMMTFVNTHNEGLVVLPTHRLVKNIDNFNHQQLLEAMRKNFDVARLAFSDMVDKKEKRQIMLDALALELANGEHAFGMYFSDDAFYVATLRDGKAAMNSAAPDKSKAWRQLDVAILHKLILEEILAIDETILKKETNVEYIKDFGPATDQAIDKVDSGQAQVLFFLNLIQAQEIETVAIAEEKMPQKSTFFYPKIFSGLVLNVLEK